MIHFFRFLLGYVKFSFSGGFYENFINDCFKSGTDIKEIGLTSDGFTAICSIKTYKRLHKIAYRHGGKVKIIKKYGLPFFLHPLKNRFGFFAGAMIFIFLLSFLEAFVWNVEIIGAENISESTIRAYLENSGLKSGVMWCDAERKTLEWNIMSDFDEISWVHINKIGTTARVEINETRKTPETPDENKLKGVKAQRKEVVATVSRTQSKMKLLSEKNYYTLVFFGLKIPLYLKLGAYDFKEENENMLTVKDCALPIGIKTATCKRFSSQKYELSDDELKFLSKKKLSAAAKNELDGFEIINSSVRYELSDEACKAVGAYIIKYKN